jgi:hypothetical protein
VIACDLETGMRSLGAASTLRGVSAGVPLLNARFEIVIDFITSMTERTHREDQLRAEDVKRHAGVGLACDACDILVASDIKRLRE